MDLRHALVLAIASLACAMTGAQAKEQLVPAPLGARLVLDAAAQGVQIYTCENRNDGYRWAFSVPDAALFDAAGRQIGIHFAGPTWQMADGSKIVGKVEAKRASPDSHAVAWLLLRVQSHAGSGVLSGVTAVRRIDTRGGLAPSQGCDAARTAQQARMRYTARYLFYSVP